MLTKLGWFDADDFRNVNEDLSKFLQVGFLEMGKRKVTSKETGHVTEVRFYLWQIVRAKTFGNILLCYSERIIVGNRWWWREWINFL